jgi:hypothetical protein
VKANETINELIKKLMKIEEQLAQRLQLTQWNYSNSNY